MYSLDPQGNTTDLIDGTTGAAPAPVCYSPDGWTGGVSTGLWTVTRSTYPAFWGAGGHLTDSELHSVQAADLVQVSASDGGRPYIPAMGSFGTPGMPGGFGGGGSPYGFDGGNPVGDEEPDDFPVDANGRAIPYKPFLHAVNMGAGAAKFLGMMAADCNPIEALRQFVTGTDSMGKKLSPFQRMMAGFTAATVGAGGLAKAGSEVPSLMRNSNKIREAIEAAMAACKVGCFVGGTPVQMSDGSTKSIEQVKQGDKVQTRNPLTGVTEISVVAKTSVHQAYETITLELADSKTGKVVERLEGTPVHPFFTPGGLVAMGELKPEMTVISRRGPPLVVKTVTRHAHPEGVSVYNFEVEGDHTYFIGKTDGGIWVHNNCDPAQIAEAISKGHAFDKHILDLNDLRGLGLRTRKQMADFVENIIRSATGTNVKSFGHGKTAYWDPSTDTIVIFDPGNRDLGTVFRPELGRRYFDTL